jgi:hypothetical protein
LGPTGLLLSVLAAGAWRPLGPWIPLIRGWGIAGSAAEESIHVVGSIPTKHTPLPYQRIVRTPSGLSQRARSPRRRVAALAAAVVLSTVGCTGRIGAVDTGRTVQFFHDDFEKGAGRWSKVDDQYVTMQRSDGGYRIRVKDPSGGIQESRQQLPDAQPAVSIEADITETAGSETFGFSGLSCYESKNTGYVFLLTPGGSYAIMKVIDAANGKRDLLANGTGAVGTFSMVTHLRADCRTSDTGTELVLAINGTEVLRAQDPQVSPPFDWLGLLVGAMQQDTTVVFDNLTGRTL